MNYRDFIETVRTRALKAAGDEGEVIINRVVKNNDTELDGLIIREKDYKVSPSIYLNYYYDKYCGGCSMDDIMNQILHEYYTHRDAIHFDPLLFEKFENIRNRIAFKIINYNSNKKYLRDIPFKRFLDLAIVYYVVFDEFMGKKATVTINNSYIRKWGITDEELEKQALNNTASILRYSIKPLATLLREHGETIPSDDDKQIYVLTNEANFNGAACILYKDLLKKVSSEIESDLYIIPSSVHEVLIIPKADNITSEELSRMVREVNETDLEREDILSDHVYEYSYKNGCITM
ncbi:DUF5688 family protein [Howardella ureilytica]|nr:DUF5688 family protein [Lachnospiraceae bacterium]MDY2956618.1 DUF5688 family protein [Lachnospiraceae bacterium]